MIAAAGCKRSLNPGPASGAANQAHRWPPRSPKSSPPTTCIRSGRACSSQVRRRHPRPRQSPDNPQIDARPNTPQSNMKGYQKNYVISSLSTSFALQNWNDADMDAADEPAPLSFQHRPHSDLVSADLVAASADRPLNNVHGGVVQLVTRRGVGVGRCRFPPGVRSWVFLPEAAVRRGSGGGGWRCRPPIARTGPLRRRRSSGRAAVRAAGRARRRRPGCR